WTYGFDALSGQARIDFDTVVPVDLSGSYDQYTYGGTFVTNGTHPILEGISSFATGTYTQYPTSATPLDAGATLIGTVGGQVAAAAAEVGGGRTVYLGPIYAGYYSGWNTVALRSGDADRLLEQAVSWALTDRDSYSFVANLGDPLFIETRTPGDATGEPGNDLDVAVTLYAPDGSQVDPADYTESSPDGRNVYIEYTAAQSGFYRVNLRAENQTRGAYVLKVSGSTANIDHTPPTVVSNSPAEGDVMAPGPLTFTATLSEELAPTGLGMDDVVLTNTDTGATVPLATNGLKGEYWNLGYSLSSLSQVDFNSIPTSTRTDAQVNFGDGDGMGGLGLYDYYAARWTGSIRIDTAGDHTFYTSSDDGSRLYIDGNLVVENNYVQGTTERSGVVNLGTGYHDIRIEFFENGGGAYIGASWTPPGGAKELIPASVLYNQYGSDLSLFNYDAATHSLTVNYNSNLAEGNYSLALVADADGFRDAQGNLLDGNGDGFGGDNFVVNFRIDAVGATALQPLEAIDPAGSMIFDPPAGGSLFGTGDQDDYTITLDAGQKASVRVTPDVAGLQVQVQLIGPDGTTVLGSASALAGETALLQNVDIAAAGSYTVRVSSLDGAGAYETQLLLNAQLENEAWSGVSNSAQVDAENIDGSAIDLAGAADRMAVVGDVSGGNDWYQFTLAAGQSASLAATRTDVPSGSGLTLRLYDSAGNNLASGIPDAGNVDQSISNFVAPAAGTYYVRISSASALPYSLVVTRSAHFGLELPAAQDISSTGQVLGAISNDGYGSSGLIRVAVLQGGYNGSVDDWLNDSGLFNFNAALVSASAIDTVAELDNYDVVVIGDQATHASLATVAPALRQWVEAGGGVVGTGWLTYAAGSATGTPVADIDAIIPVDTSSYYAYQSNPLIDINTAVHPVTIGVADFYPGTYSNDTASADAWGTVLASANGRASVVVGQAGNGRSVYLSPIYNDSSAALGSGPADRLFEQAVAWAAGDHSDSYTFHATAGQELTITTTTPGDGAGEPVNLLDARIEVYDETGALVASDDNGAADGRNASLIFTPASSGLYEVRVIAAGSGLAAQGDYVLRVVGANADLALNAAPEVVADSANGVNYLAPPTTLTLTFSEALLATSVIASDLVLDNGASATDVTFIDGRTLQFALTATDTDGAYHYSLAAGAVTDLQGRSNIVHDGLFTVDHSGPQVVAESADGNAPFNTIDLTFDETLNAATVSTADIASFSGPTGNDLLGAISGVSVVGGNTVRVTFSNQYAEGDYTLVLSPTLTDAVGNAMNQDGDINNGEAGEDGYTAVVHVNSVDLVAPVVTAPVSALFGQQITVNWVGHNSLSAPATANWYDYVVLSSDAILDGGDNYIAYDYPGAQPLAGHSDYNGSATFSLPLNQTLVDGTYYLFVHSDQGNSQAEADNNNNISTALPIQLSFGNRPDLVVSNLDVVATPQMESGASVTVSWNTENAGNGVMDGHFYDRVNVFNVTTGTNLGDWDYWYDGRATANNIAAGASIARQATISLSDGPSAVGELRFTVTTDVYGYVFERTTSGVNGENNNASNVVRTSTLASYADLRVENLAVTPTDPETGSTIHIAWTDANHGTNATESNFYDRVRVVNTSTGTTLLDTWQHYSGAAIAAGGNLERAYDFRIPDGPTGVGVLQVSIYSDVGGNIYEYLVGTSAEANNEASTTVTSTLAMYADLEVANLAISPSAPQSGEEVTINWNDLNNGNLASGAYSNLVSVWNNSTSQWMAYTSVAAGSVAAGGSAARSFTFNLPDGNAGVGNLTFRVTNDWGNQVFEYNAGGTGESNNDDHSLDAASSIAPYPDLVVQDLAVNGGLLSGGVMHITWNDVNAGNASADSSWYDLVQVVNTRTGQTLLSTTLYHNAGDEGGVGASLELARSYDFTLPDGSAGVGDLQITVTSDWHNHQYEYNAAGTGNSNNAATISASSSIGAYADLQVQNLTLTPSSGLQSGGVLHIEWDDTNSGNAAANANWYDRIVVVNTSTGATLLDTNVYHSAGEEGALGAGASLSRDYDFLLPNGDAGVGDLQVTVTTDAYGYQYEHNGNGIDPSTAESNNSATAATSSTIAPYADLQVQDLVATPSSLHSGEVLHISWNDTNTGNLAAGSSWYDRIVVRNTTTGINLLDTVIHHNAVTEGSLALGASLARAYNFTLPNGDAGVGDLQVTVTADVYNYQYEYNAGGTAESNNAASTAATATIAPYADLQVQNLVASPASLLTGQTLHITWDDANTGNLATSTNWYDHIVVVNATTGATVLNTTVYHNHSAQGPVGAGSSLARSYDFSLPNGDAAVGEYVVTVTADVYGYQYEYNSAGTAETNNSAASASVNVTLSPYADLQVQNLSVTPDLQSGDAVTISWEDANTGNAAALGSFYDYIRVFNNSTGQWLYSATQYHNVATEGAIGAGSALTRTASFTLPNGVAGVGDLTFTVTTDWYNQQYEYNASGTGESNNEAVAAEASTIADYADLGVRNLAVVGSLQSGGSVTLNWEVLNSGSAATANSFHERVLVVNQDTGATLVNTWVQYNQATDGGIGAGEFRSRSHAFSLPEGLNGAGNLLITVTADIGNALHEYNAGGSGETNNSADLGVVSALAPYPNLTLTDIVAPTNALAGRTMALSWTATNTGDGAVAGNWYDQVFLSSDGVVGGDIYLGTFYYAGNSLNPGDAVTRTETVTLPATLSGSYRFVVRTDASNAVFELNNDDNVAVDADAVDVGAALNLSITPANVGEAGGTATGTITRAGDTGAALEVTLSSDIGGLSVPASVTIAAGQASTNFAIAAINNGLDDGNRTVTLTASAAGLADGADTLGIIDDDQAALGMSSLTSVEENYGAVLVTITRNTDTSGPLTVNLTNDQPGRMTVPASVTFAAGESSATFEVTPVNNTIAEGNRTVRVSASAAGHNGASLQYLVIDDDVPNITLSLASQIISEGGGSTATWGTITRSDVTDSAVIIALHGDPARARVPTYLTIGAGEASVSFAIAAVDNALADGDHTVNILAEVADMFTFISLPDTRVSRSLLITDNDGPTLSLSVNSSILQEVGAGATATVTRNTAPSGDLVVVLSSSDASEATVPATVTIPDGQSSVTFAISPVSDGIQDGTQNVTVVAGADGFNSASTTLQVTDRELANLVVTAITLPESAWTQSLINVDWTVANTGLGLASGTWTDTVFISVDNMLSADDTQIGVFGNVDALDVGESYSNSVSVQLGNRVGPLYAFVVTDGGGAVMELVEGDNFDGSDQPVVVAASYIAYVNTEFEMGANPGSISMHGFAQDLTASTYAGKAFAPVTIQVITGNTTRTITTISNSMGNFTANFVPLPGEAGHYIINAGHPNVFERAEQDNFDILGMSATGTIAASLIPGQSTSGTVTLNNRSPVDLTSLSVVAPSLPPGLSLQTSLESSVLDGNDSVVLHYTLTADAAMGALNGSATVQVTSAEGVSVNVPLTISVTPLRANLVANPGYVRSGMLRGEQTLVSFEVTNTGGADTGALRVELPNLEWLSLASLSSLPSLAPGERATVTLRLTPSETLELLRYDGNIIVAGTNTHVSVPFQFRAVSEASGSVQVTVTDEYTYFAEGAPNLAGATVTLTDPYTYEVIAQAVTDASGVVRFDGVPEGPYALDVSAASHDRYRSSVVVTPGGEIEASVFLHRQVVSYNWTVVPTEVEDRYRITLETTFETEVPMPVVTVDEPFVMPLVIRGHTTQFNITLRNHGLINAEQVQIRVPIDDTYIIEPLVDFIDILPAKSEVTIPVTIRFREPGEELATAGDLQPSGPAGAILKCLGIDTLYTYKCVNNQWVSVPISLAPVGCLEDIGGAGSAAAELLSDPSNANLFNAGCDVLGMALECSGLIENDCLKALITTACSAGAGAVAGAAAGGIGAIPGAIGGALGNWDDILECLCSLDLGLGGGSSGPGGGGGG
ncbi:MAG: CARDB domain-containing protein, partial [Moraxellaceae bacterium]|nr:CARDB domain-containing protein [Moraxellaceae bacterium]